jgi:hypothetical protein
MQIPIRLERFLTSKVLPKQHETPPLNTLNHYHDIINDLVDKKMKQMVIN